MHDEQVLTKTKRAGLHELVAPRLTTFIVDTAHCLHMGSRITSDRTRLLYTATFFPPPRIYPAPRPRFRAASGLSGLERAVLDI
jgi:hypothetical protein